MARPVARARLGANSTGQRRGRGRWCSGSSCGLGALTTNGLLMRTSSAPSSPRRETRLCSAPGRPSGCSAKQPPAACAAQLDRRVSGADRPRARGPRAGSQRPQQPSDRSTALPERQAVRNHVSNILTRIHAGDRSEAIVRARKAGLGGQHIPGHARSTHSATEVTADEGPPAAGRSPELWCSRSWLYARTRFTPPLRGRRREVAFVQSVRQVVDRADCSHAEEVMAARSPGGDAILDPGERGEARQRAQHEDDEEAGDRAVPTER